MQTNLRRLMYQFHCKKMLTKYVLRTQVLYSMKYRQKIYMEIWKEMKDELNSITLEEFVGLRPKCYSYHPWQKCVLNHDI